MTFDNDIETVNRLLTGLLGDMEQEKTELTELALNSNGNLSKKQFEIHFHRMNSLVVFESRLKEIIDSLSNINASELKSFEKNDKAQVYLMKIHNKFSKESSELSLKLNNHEERTLKDLIFYTELQRNIVSIKDLIDLMKN